MARYNKIRKMDISNGPGTRVSIFFQGCHFHCFNCFNPETHDFNAGKEFNQSTIDTVLMLSNKDWVKGLSILGGEPLHPDNIAAACQLCKEFKRNFPDKTIWMWTGYLYEGRKNEEIFQYIDVLIDGQFKNELSDPRLKWKGSSNQRVIDIQQSRMANEIVLYNH